MNEPIEKVNQQCDEIRVALLDKKYRFHREIFEALGIPKATYYRRLEKIRAEDTEDAEELRRLTLGDRTQRIKDALELVSSTNLNIMESEDTPAKDRIAASAAYLSAEYWIWKAEQAGPHLPQITAFLNKDKNAIQISGPTTGNTENNQ